LLVLFLLIQVFICFERYKRNTRKMKKVINPVV